MLNLKSLILQTLLPLTMLISGCSSIPSGSHDHIELNVMTFNIRNGKAKDGLNHWDHRKSFVCDVIYKHQSDVIGLQEAYYFQIEYMIKELSTYTAIGVGRDGEQRGEHCSILYNHDRYDLLESDTFWLSDTPEKPSAHWGNRYRRICTWGRFKEISTERSFYVFNTHLDHQSQASRERSVRLIMQRVNGRAHQDPFILMGDLNADEDNPAIAFLTSEVSSTPLVDSFRVVHPEMKDVGTGSRWNGHSTGPKIDYILVTPKTTIHTATIHRTNHNGRYPSDHYPVSAHLSLEHFK